MVDLVERRHGLAGPLSVEPGGTGDLVLAREEPLAVLLAVPVEVDGRKAPRERRLADLARAGEKRHLAVLPEMLAQERVVHARNVAHGAGF